MTMQQPQEHGDEDTHGHWHGWAHPIKVISIL
jgi:hypothetical protein